jgi:hypothetical protein
VKKAPAPAYGLMMTARRRPEHVPVIIDLDYPQVRIPHATRRRRTRMGVGLVVATPNVL